MIIIEIFCLLTYSRDELISWQFAWDNLERRKEKCEEDTFTSHLSFSFCWRRSFGCLFVISVWRNLVLVSHRFHISPQMLTEKRNSVSPVCTFTMKPVSHVPWSAPIQLNYWHRCGLSSTSWTSLCQHFATDTVHMATATIRSVLTSVSVCRSSLNESGFWPPLHVPTLEPEVRFDLYPRRQFTSRCNSLILTVQMKPTNNTLF